ncbi:MAG: LysM peptidoglycan-binding domain-containing protein [Actinomyces graevenitzii]|nr:LysM peptidoglycan-binding domain-containing protein [Actinomyces graevenitzii]
MSKSLKCWLGLHLVAWLGTALSVLLLAAAAALLRPLSLQYLSLWSMADVSTALAGLAAGAGAVLVAWHALGAIWVLLSACTHRTLNLRHSAPLVRKLATGATIIALSCAPASANDDNLGWGAHGPGPRPTASASATASPTSHASASPSTRPTSRASTSPSSRASASPTSRASARATAAPSASNRPSTRASASPSRSSAHPRTGSHPRTGGPGAKTPGAKAPGKAPGAKGPGAKAAPDTKTDSKASAKSAIPKPSGAQRSGTCVPAPAAKPAPVIRQHLVLAGESLWSISVQWLRQNGVLSPTNGQIAQLSKQIFAANAALIGSNPDLIRPGLTLTIPTKG